MPAQTRRGLIAGAFANVYDWCSVEGHCEDKEERMNAQWLARGVLRQIGATEEELTAEAVRFVKTKTEQGHRHRDGSAKMRSLGYGDETCVPLDLAAEHCACVVATVKYCFGLD